MSNVQQTDEPLSMIERVAAAMEAKRHELIAKPLNRIWPDVARAAIEAMRRPTEGMVDAGSWGHGGSVVTQWESMIDNALEGK